MVKLYNVVARTENQRWSVMKRRYRMLVVVPRTLSTRWRAFSPTSGIPRTDYNLLALNLPEGWVVESVTEDTAISEPSVYTLSVTEAL